MKLTSILLLGIFILALFVRIVGTNPGHWEYHPDEPTSYDAAASMIINHDINPRRFDYPAAFPIIHMVAYNSFFVPMRLTSLLFEKPTIVISAFLQLDKFPGNIADDLFGKRGIDALFWSRYVTAILGALTIFALYYLCRILFSSTVGLIASFFLAFNFLHVLRSHLALPDIPNALLTLLAFIAIVQLFKKNSAKNYYMAAVAIGLVFAIKLQVFIILPFVFIHVLWSIRNKSLSRLFRKEVFLSGIIAIVTFFVINPYLPFHIAPAPVNNRIDSFITSNEVTQSRYLFGSNVFNPYGPFFLYHWGIGKGVSLSILVGAALMLVVSRTRFFLLMSLVMPFLYAFLYYGGGGAGYYVRNYATIIPFLLIFAGFFYAQLFRMLLKHTKLAKTLVAFSMCVLLVVVSWDQIVRSSSLAYYWSKPWLHEVTAKWAGEHLPKDAQIEESSGLVQGHMMQHAAFTNLVYWGRDSVYSVMSLAEMEQEGSDFVLIVSNQVQHQTIHWTNSLTITDFFDYDDVPYRKLDNSYVGLSVYQMFDYTVYSAYHPIEYPSQFYIISKIPKTNTEVVKTIETFEFDTPQSVWKPLKLKNDSTKLTWIDAVGYEKLGSLRFLANGKSETRFSSPILPVEEGKVYQIEGKVKNSHKTVRTERSVFLRADFHESEKAAQNISRGVHTAVSSRLWGSTDWQELKTTTIKVPKGVRFMRIAIQADGDFKNDVLIDSVSISEVEVVEPYSNITIKPVRIPSTYIYPKAIL